MEALRDWVVLLLRLNIIKVQTLLVRRCAVNRQLTQEKFLPLPKGPPVECPVASRQRFRCERFANASRFYLALDEFMATQVAPAPARPAVDNVVIETRNLSKVYRDFWGRQKVRALKALDLTIHRGEIFGLLGPNGSGKTTTIKLLLGLLFPTSGHALVFNRDATEVSKNERIGYLPEESYLYKFL